MVAEYGQPAGKTIAGNLPVGRLVGTRAHIGGRSSGSRFKPDGDRSRPVHVCFANQFCDNNVFGFELLSVGASRRVRSHSG